MRTSSFTTDSPCLSVSGVRYLSRGIWLKSNVAPRALAGSAMIANAPGTVNDIVDEQYRALAFSIWSIGPMSGPVTGPIAGGFAAQYLGWRWTNWLVMILSGLGWIMCSLAKETYAPVLLQRKAAKIREETGDDRWWCRYDQRLSSKSLGNRSLKLSAPDL
jgi:MFS family permease